MNDTGTRSLVSFATLKPETLTALLVLLAAALMMLVMKGLNPSFGSVQQIAAILTTSIFLVVASYGQGLIILLGGIDLSIGVVMSIAGMMIAGLTNGSNEALTWALPVTLVSCAAIGLLNGLGVAFLKIPPFIMTLAVGTAFFGVALGITAGSSQRTVAPALQVLMSAQIGGIPIPIGLIGCFLVAGSLLQSRTTEGRKLYAIGSSLAAARVVGLPIGALTIAAYGISGSCAGIAGLLLAGYSSSATLDMGDPFLMPTIAAVVIGGACVTGGRGLYFGTFAGAIFLSALSTIITVLSLSQGWRNIIQGGIIIIALIVQSKQWYLLSIVNRRLSGKRSPYGVVPQNSEL
jgi:Ribose/xylose/arabinose/galactoside ABC-type transport systems, permease components